MSRLLPILLLFGLLAAPSARADDQDELTRRVLILTRVLAYDRGLLERAGDEVSVGLVHVAEDPASRAEAERMAEVFAEMSDVRILGARLSAVLVPVGELSAHTDMNALLLCSGLQDSLDTLTTASRANDQITLTLHRDYVTHGASVGVTWADDRAGIVVNLPASREEGAKFGSDLLKLAEVIR